MPWIEKRYYVGDTVFVKRCFASRYAQHRQVVHIQNKTTEAQQRVNDKNAMYRYSILANANFKESDYFITYTFRRGALPGNVEECKALFQQYRRKLRAVYRKKGLEFKFIQVYEHEGVRPHIHLLFNNDGVNLKELPKWEYGTAHIELLDDREYHTIGEYFVKECSTDEEDGRQKGELSSSRGNLIRPEPEIIILDAPDWEDKPQADEGYEIDWESLENGWVEVLDKRLNFRYQFFRMVRRRE